MRKPSDADSAHSHQIDENVAGDFLIIFTRCPLPGKTKTRLIPAIGDVGAADLQRDMTLHALSNIAMFVEKRDVTVELHYAGGSESQAADVFGCSWTYVKQTPGDLGKKMRGAADRAFNRGAQTVVVMGADCPEITEDVLAEAFDKARTTDVVFNPATDGGYVLVGLRKPAPEIFEGMTWGGADVLRDSCVAAQRAGLSVDLLEPLSDVDGGEDLSVWRLADEKRRDDPRVPRISIVIPAINESSGIEATLAVAATGRGVELIVVDGGSTDDTRSIAERYGARIVSSARGRGLQMNAGATTATGEILLFLHADTLLPPGYDRAIRDAMEKPGVVAGAFRLCIDSSGRSLRIIERVVGFRSRVLRLPYGDQAIFVGRKAFHEVGGYLQQPIMEDYALMRSLRKRGRIVMVNLQVKTSARRWLENGIWRTTLRNQLYTIAYKLGISAKRIESWRRTQKAPSVIEVLEGDRGLQSQSLVQLALDTHPKQVAMPRRCSSSIRTQRAPTVEHDPPRRETSLTEHHES